MVQTAVLTCRAAARYWGEDAGNRVERVIFHELAIPATYPAKMTELGWRSRDTSFTRHNTTYLYIKESS